MRIKKEKITMKKGKVTAMLLCAVTALTLAACGRESGDGQTALHRIVLHRIVLHRTALRRTALHQTVPHPAAVS